MKNKTQAQPRGIKKEREKAPRRASHVEPIAGIETSERVLNWIRDLHVLTGSVVTLGCYCSRHGSNLLGRTPNVKY